MRYRAQNHLKTQNGHTQVKHGFKGRTSFTFSSLDIAPKRILLNQTTENCHVTLIFGQSKPTPTVRPAAYNLYAC